MKKDGYVPKWKMVCGSSNLSKAIYYPTKKSLVVEFANGGKYEYKDVPPKKFYDLSVAESQGSYFSKSIKGKYECVAQGVVE